MQNIKLTLRYDGSAYHGWQIQNNAVTVQQTVTDAIKKITGEDVNLIGCGRTDAGVHANRYICNFKTNSHIPPERYAYALNTHLPDDLVCVRSDVVNDEFHSKYSAKKKNYIYRILNSEYPDPFFRNRVWHIKGSLDTHEMLRAAEAFVGTHDFSGFASSGLTVKTTVRTIYKCEVYKEGDIITVDIEGNGFLYNMVRIITGTLVWVGMGKLRAEDMSDIIRSCDRTRGGITAPPDGLFLWGVEY